MDIETKLQLFDSIVTPILLYGSEVWGFENISNVEKIQIRFYKLLLGLNGSVSNVVTFGELGKFPLRVLCKERILKVSGPFIETSCVFQCIKKYHKC